MTLLQRAKDSAVRAGLDPWLRPIANIILRRRPDEDDRCASAIISSLKRDAVFVDIGCNKGKILDLMRRAAPDGVFFAFEPVPYLFELLSEIRDRFECEKDAIGRGAAHKIENLALVAADINKDSIAFQGRNNR